MNHDENYKPLINLVIVLLLFYCSSLFSLLPIYLFNIDVKNCNDTVFYSTKLFANLMTSLILFFIYKKNLKHEFQEMKKKFTKISYTAIKYWIFGFIFMTLSSYIIGKYSPISIPSNELGVRKIINSSPLIAFLMTCICAPFTEEIIFRKAFKDSIKTNWLFILISAFVFGSLHVIGDINSLYELLYIIPYMSLGLSFALAYNKTNNIFASIFIHFIHNTIGILLICFG